jgi:hypothetical protein
MKRQGANKNGIEEKTSSLPEHHDSVTARGVRHEAWPGQAKEVGPTEIQFSLTEMRRPRRIVAFLFERKNDSMKVVFFIGIFMPSFFL